MLLLPHGGHGTRGWEYMLGGYILLLRVRVRVPRTGGTRVLPSCRVAGSAGSAGSAGWCRVVPGGAAGAGDG